MVKNKSFLLQVLEDINSENTSNNWRGTITSWIRC